MGWGPLPPPIAWPGHSCLVCFGETWWYLVQLMQLSQLTQCSNPQSSSCLVHFCPCMGPVLGLMTRTDASQRDLAAHTNPCGWPQRQGSWERERRGPWQALLPSTKQSLVLNSSRGRGSWVKQMPDLCNFCSDLYLSTLYRTTFGLEQQKIRKHHRFWRVTVRLVIHWEFIEALMEAAVYMDYGLYVQSPGVVLFNFTCRFNRFHWSGCQVAPG
jgi:hypothetical protein